MVFFGPDCKARGYVSERLCIHVNILSPTITSLLMHVATSSLRLQTVKQSFKTITDQISKEKHSLEFSVLFSLCCSFDTNRTILLQIHVYVLGYVMNIRLSA